MRSQPPVGAVLDKSHALSQGLVGYWLLNEPGGLKAYDLVQGARGIGAVTGTTIGTGREAGVSRVFNGTSDKIIATSINSTDGQINNSLTFTAWIYHTANTGNNCALGCGSTSTYYLFLGVNGSTSQLDMYDGTHNPVLNGGTAAQNKWCFLAGVRDKNAGTLALYLDGVLQGTTTDTTVAGFAYDSICIGTVGTGSSFYFTGRVENCRVYNRALTRVEIARLYAEPYAGVGVERRIPRRLATSGNNVLPDVGAVSLTGFAPTVTATANQNAFPPVGAVTLTGFAPTVTSANNQNAAPGVGVLTVTGFAPTVVATDPKNILPGAGVISVTGFAPSLASSSNNNVLPGLGVLTVTGFAPTVRATNATHLGIISQPTTFFTQRLATTNYVVAAQDAGGATVTDFVGSCHLAANTPSFGIVVGTGGTTSRSFVAGLATFDNITALCSDGATVTVTFTTTGLTSVNSAIITGTVKSNDSVATVT